MDELKINEVKFGKNRVMYVPVFEDKSLTILQEFLASEVRNFKANILETIEKARETSGKVKFAGNSCLLCIDNGKVRVECALDEAEMGDPVEMQLDEFIQLIQSWIKDTNI